MHRRSRHRVGGVVVARTRIVNPLVAEQEEGLVLAVVDMRDVHRTAEGTAPGIEGEVRTRGAGLVQEEVVGPETRALEGIVRGAVEVVGAGFDADVGDTALRLPELCVEGRGLHLEFLHDVGGRHVGRRHLVGIGARSGRRAVDRHVVQQAAGAAHREVHNVGRLERTVQPDAAVKGHARREPDQQERVAVRKRQVRHSLGIHHRAQRGGLRVRERQFGTYRHLLLRCADFQCDVDIQPIGDPDFDSTAQGPS